MNLILKEILNINDWENLYNFYARKNTLNSINCKLITQQNFENFQNFIQGIVQKGPRKSKKRWVSNERRILHILLNCISVIKNQPMQQFKNEEIQRINRVFPYKDKYSIEYELKKLSSSNKQNRRRWSQKEENFLEDIVNKTQNKNKWNEIARELFIFSKGEHFRQGKHCRQRFYKLKQGKGQHSLSEDLQSSDESEQRDSLRFQSHNSVKQPEGIEILQEVIEDQKPANFIKFNCKKQVDYNQKVIESSLSQKHPDGKSHKSDPSKNQPSKREKTTQQSIQEERQRSSSLLREKDNFQVQNNEFYSSKDFNSNPKVAIEGKQNFQTQKVSNPPMQNQEKIIPEVVYNPFALNMPNDQQQGNINIMGQMWLGPVNYWPMGAFPFNFQGFY